MSIDTILYAVGSVLGALFMMYVISSIIVTRVTVGRMRKELAAARREIAALNKMLLEATR